MSFPFSLSVQTELAEERWDQQRAALSVLLYMVDVRRFLAAWICPSYKLVVPSQPLVCWLQHWVIRIRLDPRWHSCTHIHALIFTLKLRLSALTLRTTADCTVLHEINNKKKVLKQNGKEKRKIDWCNEIKQLWRSAYLKVWRWNEAVFCDVKGFGHIRWTDHRWPQVSNFNFFLTTNSRTTLSFLILVLIKQSACPCFARARLVLVQGSSPNYSAGLK